MDVDADADAGEEEWERPPQETYTFTFFDHRHSCIYMVENSYDVYDAKSFLKEELMAGHAWDSTVTDKELWDNVVLVEQVEKLWCEGNRRMPYEAPPSSCWKRKREKRISLL
jgi:hypothetical protein